MGEFDEGTVSEPSEVVSEPVAPNVDAMPTAEFEAVGAPPAGPVPAPVVVPVAASTAEPVTEPAVEPAPAPAAVAPAEPAVSAPAEESSADLVSRLAAELSAEMDAEAHPELAPPGADSAQEQLALDVPVGAAAAAAVPAVADSATTATASDADDLAAALEAANEQIGVEPTLDDIAPRTMHYDDDEGFEASAPRFGAPWWPFLVYLVAWIAFSVFGALQLKQLPVTQVAYESDFYTTFVFGGLIMAAVGPILILAVWLGALFGNTRHRAGLFTSAFIKGAIVTVVGVAVWWGTFMAVDFIRLGRLF